MLNTDPRAQVGMPFLAVEHFAVCIVVALTLVKCQVITKFLGVESKKVHVSAWTRRIEPPERSIGVAECHFVKVDVVDFVLPSASIRVVRGARMDIDRFGDNVLESALHYKR